MQEVSPVFAEKDEVVTVALHSLLVVIHQDEAPSRIIKHGACYPQGLVDIRR